MTLVQLESIFKANIGVGFLEALEAVYTHGWYDGAGVSIAANSLSKVPPAAAPTTIVKFTGTHLR